MSTREKMAQQYADEQWPSLKEVERTLVNEPMFSERDETVSDFLAGFAAGAKQTRERAAKSCGQYTAIAEALRTLPLDDGSEGT